MADPITVGGGGGLALNIITECDFDEATFTDQTGGGAGPKHRDFVHKTNLAAKSLKVTLEGKTVDFSSLLPANGECQVEVKCPGVNDDVTIKGNPLRIRMHTGTYPRDAADPKKHVGHNSVNEIKISVANQVIEIQQPSGMFNVEVTT